jgi:hypothetical protein
MVIRKLACWREKQLHEKEVEMADLINHSSPKDDDSCETDLGQREPIARPMPSPKSLHVT